MQNELMTENVNKIFSMIKIQNEQARSKVFRKRTSKPNESRCLKAIVSNVLRLFYIDDSKTIAFATFDSFSEEDIVSVVFNMTGDKGDITSAAPVPMKMFNKIIERVIACSTPENIVNNVINTFYKLDHEFLTKEELIFISKRTEEYNKEIKNFQSEVENKMASLAVELEFLNLAESKVFKKSFEIEDKITNSDEFKLVKNLEDQLDIAKKNLQEKRDTLILDPELKEAEAIVKQHRHEFSKAAHSSAEDLIIHVRDQGHAEIAATKQILIDALKNISATTLNKSRVKHLGVEALKAIIIKTGSAFFLAPHEGCASKRKQ
ncbi:hypothetical protein [Photobacterium kishitanii]|uniref:Uncharacterized protein n=1 Tax=Photobacterium kishitanii TaxID=318456 RepID=A0A2T3KLL7_9GAMM|nr:hypothetical protein [Photobacterium kishitanii]PSV00614.1 hypothetical protein C9J27_05615 [Photobacterium kishitanii]